MMLNLSRSRTTPTSGLTEFCVLIVLSLHPSLTVELSRLRPIARCLLM